MVAVSSTAVMSVRCVIASSMVASLKSKMFEIMSLALSPITPVSSPCVHHHEDFFLSDRLFIFVGVISHQFEHEIGRCGQEGDKRVEDGGDGV